MTKTTVTLLFSLFLSVTSALAGEITFTGQSDKNPLEYNLGETMVFTVQCLEDGRPVSGQKIGWKRTGDDGKVETGIVTSNATQPLTITTSLECPGFVRIQVYQVDDNGNIVGGEHNEAHQFNGGAGVLLQQIEGYPEPDDFDAFWKQQKDILARVPIKASLTPVESTIPEVVCFEIKIDNSSLTPVSGYLYMPKEAKEKSLPAKVCYQGYSVAPVNKNCELGRYQICLEINCHGVLNGQVKEYYDTLSQTFLNRYGFSVSENNVPESCYWCGMMMRALRAVQYVKTLPEWNGVDLITSGGSQGGMQCLTVAGLDPDVTEVYAYVPWFCDPSGAEKSGRIDSWFMPAWTEGLGYFDTANHARRIKGKVYIHAGLGDYVCPPSGQLVLYNAIKTEVKLEFQQGKTHGYNMPDGKVYVLEKAAL